MTCAWIASLRLRAGSSWAGKSEKPFEGGKPKSSAYLYWSYMPLGRPFSQFCGVLQGRSDKFCDSVLAHPPKANPPTTSSSRNTQRALERTPLMTQDGQE